MVTPDPSDPGPQKAKKYSDIFREMFPSYLAMGMSYHQYWEEDSTLVVAYRKAEEIRNDKLNQQLWLQGMYIYEALCDVAPILRAFTKRGAKPHKYPEQPWNLTEKAREKEKEEREQKVYQKGMDRMKAFMSATNKKFGEVNKVADGN